jgi:hypothetical protein
MLKLMMMVHSKTSHLLLLLSARGNERSTNYAEMRTKPSFGGLYGDKLVSRTAPNYAELKHFQITSGVSAGLVSEGNFPAGHEFWVGLPNLGALRCVADMGLLKLSAPAGLKLSPNHTGTRHRFTRRRDL